MPAYVSGLFAMREKNLMTVTEDATNLAGMDGADLVAWIKDDERHAAFFGEALDRMEHTRSAQAAHPVVRTCGELQR